jgi:PhzF family phenazine biosynthesis protein
MKITIYQIDAFTDTVFSGNPAAVCILNEWLDEVLMQTIAEENNLSETAFAVKNNGVFEIRWFTPTVEIDLCGHATLATAFVLFEYYNITEESIQFFSHRSGNLSVTKGSNDNLTLNFPVNLPIITEENLELNKALGAIPIKTLKSAFDYLLIFKTQQEIENLKPDFSALKKIDTRGIMVSSEGDKVDFVSRFFAPGAGIDEDPVTGSAHCTLVPYWSKALKKDKLSAKQVSKRGGDLYCELVDDRVNISGKAITYMIGEIHI